ncbi:MAG: hypothetical protein QG553_520 [Patescibacteria group bacterium]|nr:hypothetical protein [Patescibacteria group bacterium]
MVNGEPSPELMYEATLELLSMSQTPCPYAGLIMRGAVTMETIATDIDDEQFLQPLNRAMTDWWEDAPLAADIVPEGLHFARSTTEVSVDPHLDQCMPIRGVQPRFGPLTATLTTRGSMDYGLATTRINAFGDGRQVRMELLKHGRELPPDAARVRANAGDLVTFTNTPPTLHGGTGSPDRHTLVYTSHFRRRIG